MNDELNGCSAFRENIPTLLDVKYFFFRHLEIVEGYRQWFVVLLVDLTFILTADHFRVIFGPMIFVVQINLALNQEIYTKITNVDKRMVNFASRISKVEWIFLWIYTSLLTLEKSETDQEYFLDNSKMNNDIRQFWWLSNDATFFK